MASGKRPRSNRGSFCRMPLDGEEQFPVKKKLKFDKEEPLSRISASFLLPDGNLIAMELQRTMWDPVSLVNELRRQAAKVPENTNRKVDWEKVWLEDEHGHHIDDVEQLFLGNQEERIILLQDGCENAIHVNQRMWNVTPEPEMLERLPDGYNLETALADHLDNALQAVWENGENVRRLMSVEIAPNNISIFDTGPGMDASGPNCIAKWGTVGASSHRNVHRLGIGGKPPFLKPYLGKFGVGGVAAAFYLGKDVEVRSKIRNSKKVVSLILKKGDLVKNQQAGRSRIWRTHGGIHDMTDEELKKSPHGSFTCVKISSLNPQACIEGAQQQYWKLSQVKQMLKDIYALYIQSDGAGSSSRTLTSVEFEVNGENLLEELGGEITTCNKHSCTGAPFIADLKFHKITSQEQAHARITCQYFPNIKGREKLDDVIDELKTDQPWRNQKENFTNFPRIGVRWLGRLLPSAKWDLLPFMSAKIPWVRRVKAFIDVDAGFRPTPTKVKLDEEHEFTTALKQLGSNIVVQDVKVELQDKELSELGAEFLKWVKVMHETYDQEAQFEDEPTYVISQDNLKKLLHVEKQILTFHRHLKLPKGDWQAGERIKLQKGNSGANKNFYGVIEWFFCDGTDEEHGEVKMICRSVEVPEDGGSKMTERQGACYFSLNKSKCFSTACLNSEKCSRMTQEEWSKQVTLLKNKSPSYIAVLNKEERQFFGEQALPKSGSIFKAGYVFPAHNLLAVVRPQKGSGPSFKQGMIVAESFKMKLEILLKAPASEEAESCGCFFATGDARNGVKGIYAFQMGKFPALQKAGEHIFMFSVVDDQQVKPASWVLHIRPLDVVRRWVVRRESDDLLTLQLDKPLDTPLFLERFDEYGNIVTFERTLDITLVLVDLQGLELARVERMNISVSDDKNKLILQGFVVTGCNLSAICPSYEALLDIYGERQKLGQLKCLVYPGKPEPFETIKSSVELVQPGHSFKRSLKPGDTIDHLVFQGKDRFGNAVVKGTKVILKLDGLVSECPESLIEVSENGTIYLSDLKVAKQYNTTGSIALHTLEDKEKMIEIEFKITDRHLKFQSEPPRNALIGRTVEGLVLALVDESGELDPSMEGTLSADWEASVCYPIVDAICKLPKINMPGKAGLWKGRVWHSASTNICLDIEIDVQMKDACGFSHEDDSQNTVTGRCGQELCLAFLAVDELGLPGVLTDEAVQNLNVDVVPENSAFPMESILQQKKFGGTAPNYNLKVILNGQKGFYNVVLSGLLNDSRLLWRLQLHPGPLARLIPMFADGDKDDQLWKAARDGIGVPSVCRRSRFPALEVCLVDSKDNICDMYEGAEVVLDVEGSEEFRQSEYVESGFATFLPFSIDLPCGHHKLHLSFEFGTNATATVMFNVEPGNYPSGLTLLDDAPVEVTLIDGEDQHIPTIRLRVESEDGLPLENCHRLMVSILKPSSEIWLTLPGEREEGSLYVFRNVPVPSQAGSFILKFFLDKNTEVTPVFLDCRVLPGKPAGLKFRTEVDPLFVEVVDSKGNRCTTSQNLQLAGTLEAYQGCAVAHYFASSTNGEAGFEELGEDLHKLGPGSYTFKVFLPDDSLPCVKMPLVAIHGQPPAEQQELSEILEQQNPHFRLCIEHYQTSEAKLKTSEARFQWLRAEIQETIERVHPLEQRSSELAQAATEDETILEGEQHQPKRTERHIVSELNFIAREKNNGAPLAINKALGTKPKDFPSSDILGLVVMMARVETENLNRILSEYLATSKLLAIVCKSSDGFQWLQSLDAEGKIDRCKGLRRFAEAHNLPLPGRFEVFILNKIEPYKGRICQHPQKLLNIADPILPSGVTPPGFLGYAVNMLHLSEVHVNLRKTLFYHLFGKLQVYDNMVNMLRAWKELRSCTAVSLDGGILTNGGAKLGTGSPPEVSFALVPFNERKQCSLVPPASFAFQREVEQAQLASEMEALDDKLMQKSHELDLVKEEMARLREIMEKFRPVMALSWEKRPYVYPLRALTWKE